MDENIQTSSLDFFTLIKIIIQMMKEKADVIIYNERIDSVMNLIKISRNLFD